MPIWEDLNAPHEIGSRAFSFGIFPVTKSKKVNNNKHLDIFPTICELTETSIPSQLIKIGRI